MPEQTPYFATPKQPRLIWNHRDRRKVAEPLPSQTTEVIRPFYAQPQGALDLITDETPQNRLIWTNDNLVALTSLLAGDASHPPLEGKVDLVYIDPPFAVQADFKINVEIENGLSDEKLPTLIEEIAYKDTWKDGLDSYLSMMRDRLELLKRLLAPTGSIYVHCDWHAGHYLKVLMDEVFGYDRFITQIVWQRVTSHSDSQGFGTNYDMLLAYTAADRGTWNPAYEPLSDSYVQSHYNQLDENGRRFRWDNATAAGQGPPREFFRKVLAPPPGTHWRWSQESIDSLIKQGRIALTSRGKPQYRRYLDENQGKQVQSIWTDIHPVNSQAHEAKGFPTQKPAALLQRIIASSSNPGDLVLDCFAGSGTTVIAAETMTDAEGKPAPRQWIAIDCGKFAVHITRKRLIEASARPFTVESIGFYTRHGEWKDIWQSSPSARMYRDAMVEVYGGSPVEGFTYLHGKKGSRWVHVGPLNAPVADAQVEAILVEAASTDTKMVDILSADIPIDWNKSEMEARYGVRVQAKIIPQAAIEAVKERIRRKQSKDPTLTAAPDIHFFSPPDVEIRADVARGAVSAVVVKLAGFTVDLDDCLSTQDPAKRAEIKAGISNWQALVDYWAVDWDYNGEFFRNDWQSFRTRKNRDLAMQAVHEYQKQKGDKRIAVKVTDIFGNDGLKVIRVSL